MIISIVILFVGDFKSNNAEISQFNSKLYKDMVFLNKWDSNVLTPQ